MTIGPAATLQDKMTLPCGAVLKNRLAKSPMSDSLGNGRGNPTETQIRLYERWMEGGTALSLIGEVQGDHRYPEKPGNLVLGPESDMGMLLTLTKRARMNNAHIWAQLGHAGALSYAPVSTPKGPSAISVGGLHCEGLSVSEIQELPALFARTARYAVSAGFSGVMIHAGHGFLLSQFLSPLFNRRDDEFGGSIENRSRIIFDIIRHVRNAVGTSFPVSIRINSSDRLEGGLSNNDALKLVRSLDKTSIDLIDISGGTYFPGAKASSDSTGKKPYYLDFAQKAREVTGIPLMLTGGFKKKEQAVDVLSKGIVDVVGLARAMVLNPRLPADWLSGHSDNPEFPDFRKTVPGGITAWYTMRMAALGSDSEDEFNMDLPEALKVYEERDLNRSKKWRN